MKQVTAEQLTDWLARGGAPLQVVQVVGLPLEPEAHDTLRCAGYYFVGAEDELLPEDRELIAACPGPLVDEDCLFAINRRAGTIDASAVAFEPGLGPHGKRLVPALEAKSRRVSDGLAHGKKPRGERHTGAPRRNQRPRPAARKSK